MVDFNKEGPLVKVNETSLGSYEKEMLTTLPTYKAQVKVEKFRNMNNLGNREPM